MESMICEPFHYVILSIAFYCVNASLWVEKTNFFEITVEPLVSGHHQGN